MLMRTMRPRIGGIVLGSWCLACVVNSAALDSLRTPAHASTGNPPLNRALACSAGTMDHDNHRLSGADSRYLPH
jgi:hypothetical protein